MALVELKTGKHSKIKAGVRIRFDKGDVFQASDEELKAFRNKFILVEEVETEVDAAKLKKDENEESEAEEQPKKKRSRRRTKKGDDESEE